MRDIAKQTKQGLKIIDSCHTLDLTAGEFKQLLDIYHDAEDRGDDPLWEVITASFLTGLAVGTRHGKKEKLDETIKTFKNIVDCEIGWGEIYQNSQDPSELLDSYRRFCRAAAFAAVLRIDCKMKTEEKENQISESEMKVGQRIVDIGWGY